MGGQPKSQWEGQPPPPPPESLGKPLPCNPSPHAFRHLWSMAQKRSAVRYVFTDVDNTLVMYGNGPKIPGGVQFLHELRGNMDDPRARQTAPKVTVLSARPDTKGLLKDKVPKLLTVDGECFYGETLHGNLISSAIAYLGQVCCVAWGGGGRGGRTTHKWVLQASVSVPLFWLACIPTFSVSSVSQPFFFCVYQVCLPIFLLVYRADFCLRWEGSKVISLF